MKSIYIVVPKDWESVGGLFLPISNYKERLFRDYQVKWLTMEYRLTQEQQKKYKKHILENICGSNDVVITFGLNQSYYVSKMLKKHNIRQIAIPMDSDFFLLKSVMKNDSNDLELREKVKRILKLLCYYWKEEKLVITTNILVYVSPYDANLVQHWYRRIKAKVVVISNGVKIPSIVYSDKHSIKEKFRIGHIGSFTQHYIEENLRFFLDFCRDELIKKYPQIEVVIAGKNISVQQLHILKTYKFVRCMGEVGEVDEFYDSVDMVFSCVKKKSGILNKNLEAFAYRKCVIGFRHNFFAIEGSNDKENCLMADTNWEFLQQMDEVLSEKINIEQIGLNAYKLVLAKYSWDERYCQLKSYIDYLQN